MKYILILLFGIGYIINIEGQAIPCNTGSENSCQCLTAYQLCSIEELDGFTYSMSLYQHPADGPQPMCPGVSNTTSNNPTWFKFVAWCTNLSVTVSYVNCLDGPGCAGGGDFGLQAAVYSNCGNLPGSVVSGGCATQVSGCNNNSSRNLNMTNLIVGKVYYFLVDGCCGSACDVAIDVTSPYCPPTIGNWPNPMTGPDRLCVNQSGNFTYNTATGGEAYFWNINGGPLLAPPDLIVTGNETSFTRNFSFASPGTYNVCVDVKNACVSISDNPPPLCKTVTVVGPVDGDIMATPNPVCPGGTVNLTTTGYDPSSTKYIVVVNSANVIVKVITGDAGNFTYTPCGNFKAYAYNFYPGVPAPPVPVLGANISTLACSNTCCMLEMIPFSFSDTSPPAFVSPPANTSYNCFNDVPAMSPLNYTDNCDAGGTVNGTQVTNYTNCAGGTITRTWTKTDLCGNIGTHVQTITILPIPVATLSGPANMTIPCAQIPAPGVLPVLTYTNNSTGSCLITGSITPTRVDNITNCAGTITYTWMATDICNRTIQHVQVLTVTPPAAAVIQSPPANQTVDCLNKPAPGVLPVLMYDNGETGTCRVFGSITPTRVDNITNCAGTITFSWNATDACGRAISHQQVLTVQAPLVATITNPPANMTVSCSSLPPAGTLPTLNYTNSSSGTCLISGSITPTRVDNIVNCAGTVTFNWQATDPCGRPITHTQVLTVQPPTAAQFVNPPASMTIDCPSVPGPGVLPTLNYTNNETGTCLISGSLTPTRVDNISNCAGTITYTWQTTDFCGRPIQYTQVLTVNPPPAAQFVNPPASMTIDCPSVPGPGVLPTLSYTNASTGSCLISGTLTPTRVDNIVNCAGTITYTWQTTDFCNRPVFYQQVLTVTPPPAAQFSNPPASMTIGCTGIPPAGTLPPLSYTNGSTGTCLISGTLTPTRVDNITNCAGTITFTWQTTDYCNRPIVHQQILTLTPPSVAQFNNPPASMTINCVDIPPAGTLPPLTYTNGEIGTCLISGTLNPTRVDNIVNCAGTITYTWQTTDFCNRPISYQQVLTVTPPPAAQFSNPPASMTIACTDIPPAGTLPPLSYTNGSTGTCLISGTLTPTRVDNITNCAGTITFTWQTTDYCNRPIIHQQVLTVTPPPAAQFTNPPASMTINCPDVPPSNVLPPLSYTNGSTGTCLISGTLNPTRVDNIVNCAGTITYTWQTTDYCNRPIYYQQVLTVLPPPAAQFVNPPASMTINCPDIPPAGTLPPLNYTNNSTGTCLISGTLTPTRVDNIVNCAGTITLTWQTTDYCNRQIQHQQVLTVLPPPEADFANPPASQTIDCSQLPAAGVLPPLNYTNGSTGSCLISGSSVPVRTDAIVNCQGTITYTWTFTDFCNRQKTHTQVLTVQPPAEAFPVNPPVSSTINCDQIPPTGSIPTLNYSNNQSGTCLVDGTMTGTRTDNLVNCAGTITFNWTATDRCGRPISHTQVLTVLPPPVVTLVNPPVYNTPLSCAQALAFTTPPISYTNSSTCLIQGTIQPVITPNFNPCGGTINVVWSGTDACNRAVTYNQIIIVQPAPAPVFTSALPQDITVNCGDLSSYAISLNYSNNLTSSCLLSGSIPGVLNQSNPLCGGTATVTWQGQDACGNSLSHVQNITVLPAPPAVFINTPPASVTLTCGLVPAQIPSLSYSNNGTGVCAIDGSVPGIVSGSYNACGGNLQYSWQFTDNCGRSIVFNQNVTVLPANQPVNFVDAPSDLNLPCGVTFDTPVELYYSNGLTGPCGISGISVPVTQDFGTYRIYTWQFTNPCTNAVSTATQKVTVVPIPNIVIDPEYVTICTGQAYDLSTVNVTDLNNQTNVISYHTASLATDFNKLTSPIVHPDASQYFYVIKATNSFGCSDEAFIQFTIITQNGAVGTDGNECIDNTPVNLWNYLTGTYDPFGYWIYTGAATLNFTDPSAVNFSNATPGLYPFAYIVQSTNGCPNDTAHVNLTLVNPGSFTVNNVACAADFQTYTVQLTATGYTVTASAGTKTMGPGNSVTISNIPIAQTVQITFTSSTGNCSPQMVSVSPPNCSCPQIPPPVSTGDKTACIDATNISLSVTAAAGLNVNWYSMATGGTLLHGNSLVYNPPTGVVGIFTYYAESIDPTNGCKSNLRTPVTIEIVPKPVVTDGILKTCDNDIDGLTTFDLATAKDSVTSNPSYVVTFHLTNMDAQAGINPLPQLFLNTIPNQTIYASVKNSSNCISIANLVLKAIAPPVATFTVSNEQCLNDNNGSIQVMSFATNTFKLNNLPYTSNPLFENLAPGDYTITVRNQELCTSTFTKTILPGQMLNIPEYTIQCNNNGTASLSTDDFYEVRFTITNTTNVLNKFEVFYNGVSKGMFSYNVSSTLSLPANGTNGLIEFVDVLLGCKTSKVVGNLSPCSTDCQISFTNLTSVCNNNGTASDGTDDFYTISLKATALNGSNTNTFNILVDNVIIGNFPYNVQINFNLPANGSTPIIVLRDQDDIQCIKSVSISALTPCSANCLINKTVSNIRCNDNGTINDPLDDTYSFDIKVTGLNVSSGWRMQGAPEVHAYGTTIKLGPFLISGGNLNSSIFDNVDTNCKSDLSVTAPNVCSEPCVLSVAEIAIGPCNDNNTGNNTTDDIFSVSFKVNVVSGSANFYYVNNGPKKYGPFTYGQNVSITDLPATGSNITLEVTDGINAGCMQSFNVSKSPCSGCNQTVEAGPDVILTCAQNTASLAGSSSVPGQFTWTGPNNFVKTGMTVQTSTPGTYYLTVVFPDQCTAKDSLKVAKDSGLPVAFAGPDMEINCKITEVTLTGSSNITTNIKYVWTNALGLEIGNTSTIKVTEPGLYYLEIINLANNCSSGKDEVNVSDNRTKPSAVIFADPGNLLDCKVGTVKLSGEVQENVIFNWQYGENTILNKNFIIINTAGQVTMIAIDTVNGCQNIGQIEIIDLQDYPILVLNPVKPITCDNNATTISAHNSPSGPNLVFAWYNSDNILIAGQNRDSLVVTIPGNYYVVLTDTLNGCSNKDTIKVNRVGEFPNIKVPDNKFLFCGKTDTILNVSVITPVEPVIIKWSTTDGTLIGSTSANSITVSGSGNYLVEVTYPTSGCKSTEDVLVTVNSNIPRLATFQVNDESCKNEKDGSFILSDIKGGVPPLKYKLNGQTATNFTNLPPAEYNFEVIDANGCKLDTIFTVLEGNAFELNTITPLELIYNQKESIKIVTNLDSNEIASIVWVPSENLSCDSCLVTTLTAKKDETFEVTVTDIYGCVASVKIIVRVKDNLTVTTPNIIHPSGTDNKYFTIYGNEGLLNVEKMSIYDRWGNLVFLKHNFKPNIPQEGWDGKFNGVDVVPGVFVFTIEYLTNSGIRITSGDVTVIK